MQVFIRFRALPHRLPVCHQFQVKAGCQHAKRAPHPKPVTRLIVCYQAHCPDSLVATVSKTRKDIASNAAPMLINIPAVRFRLSISQLAINNGLANQAMPEIPLVSPAHPNSNTMIESLHCVAVQYAFWVSERAKSRMLSLTRFFLKADRSLVACIVSELGFLITRPAHDSCKEKIKHFLAASFLQNLESQH